MHSHGLPVELQIHLINKCNTNIQSMNYESRFDTPHHGSPHHHYCTVISIHRQVNSHVNLKNDLQVCAHKCKRKHHCLPRPRAKRRPKNKCLKLYVRNGVRCKKHVNTCVRVTQTKLRIVFDHTVDTKLISVIQNDVHVPSSKICSVYYNFKKNKKKLYKSSLLKI